MYRFTSLLWFLIYFKQTTRKSNNSAKIVQTIDRHFHEIHVPYVDMSLPASSYIFGTYPWLQNLYLLLGSMWHWATNSDLGHLEASLRRKNEDMCGRILLMYYILCFGVLFLSVCVYYLKYWYLSLEPNFLWSLWAASSTTDSNTVMNAVILLYWSPEQVSKHSICSVSNCDNIHGKMSLEN